MSSKSENTRKEDVDIYLKNPNLSYSDIGKGAGITRQTARNIILKFLRDKTTKRLKAGGRCSGTIDKIGEKKVLGALKRNPGLSVRDLAKKTGLAKSTVQDIKCRNNLRSFKVQKMPNRNDEQDKRAKTRARRLLDKMLNGFSGCIIQDDETYIKADFRQMPGSVFYSAVSRGGVKKIYKYRKVDKFAKKYLLWQALCTCGRRSSVFVTKATMNGRLYINECLKKRLLPLYKAHTIKPLFWPDLSTVHYAKDSVAWYTSNGVKYVTKECNPPNTPEIRPIEKWWGITKSKLIKSKKIAKDEKHLRKIWTQQANILGDTTVQRLMGGIKRKVRNFAKTPISEF